MFILFFLSYQSLDLSFDGSEPNGTAQRGQGKQRNLLHSNLPLLIFQRQICPLDLDGGFVYTPQRRKTNLFILDDLTISQVRVRYKDMTPSCTDHVPDQNRTFPPHLWRTKRIAHRDWNVNLRGCRILIIYRTNLTRQLTSMMRGLTI